MTEIQIRRESTEDYLDTFPYENLTTISMSFKQRYIVSIIYLMLGLVLIICLFNIFNVYVVHLKIESSVVSSPIETMVAPAAGYIKEVYVTPGMQVKKGDALIKIENINLERDQQLARIQVEDSKLTIAYLQTLLANERLKLNVYKLIGTNRVASTQATVEQYASEWMAAKNNLNRMQLLLKKHFITLANWDEAVARYKSAEDKMKSATAQKNIEVSSLGAIVNGFYFTGEKLEGIVNDLTAQINAAQNRLMLNQERLNVYNNVVSKLTLLAPFDGKVTEILKSVGTTTDSVKPIILLTQTTTNKNIVAYLTQDEITHVRVNGNVNIYIPALGNTYHGKLINIDRTSGFVDEINAQYRWRDLQIDRSATALIEIDHREQNKFNRQVIAGMPAIVYFSRKFTWL